MTSLARKHESGFANGSFDIEKVAVEKNQEYEKERTWWIFEDGSALGLDSSNVIYVINQYGRHADHEKLGE
jgi:hypothetical protein